jgi:hypothetical protein
MPAVPAVIFFAAALLCSVIGRALLSKAAFGVSKQWGFAAVLAPFGPVFFRLKFPELAQPTRYWRWAVGPLMLVFFFDGGTTTSLRVLGNIGRPKNEEASAGDTQFHLPVPVKVVAAVAGKADAAAAKTAAGSTPAPSTAGAATTGKTAPAGATPSPAVAAAVSSMPPAPKVLSPAERMEANRKELEHLADWYDNLKHERGYLTKGDAAGVQAFNEDVAKYQAALQIAKTEQAELTKLTAKK